MELGQIRFDPWEEGPRGRASFPRLLLTRKKVHLWTPRDSVIMLRLIKAAFDRRRSWSLLLLSVFQINLRLILVSGKTKEFLFSPNDSAADIAKHVYDNWPMGKPLDSRRRRLLLL